MKACKTCKFWQNDIPQQYVYGDCHRYPPGQRMSVSCRGSQYEKVEMTLHTSADPIWPNTHESHWCGEHKQLEQEG